ncbi:phosphatidate cytidylyltransferase [Nostocoides sp.]|uniref:phosphatidate cytidylyltransferase n=1 Tax=Nostocoides sp. TaxID=1917966 RepID=UPI002B74C7F4|nr:phosphatidate cytidylyltransferase [Tetrasphaera sp.]
MTVPITPPAPGDAAPVAPANPHGRAGRDLAAAVGVGLALAAGILGCLLWAKDAFVWIIAAAMVVGAWELARAMANRGFAVPLVPVGVGAIGMILAAHQRGPEGLAIAFGLTAVGILIWRVIDPRPAAARDIAGGIFTALYPCFLGGFAAMMLAPADGRDRIITFILVTACSDIGGYAAGVLFGKHPMAPRISPKKSWEGFAGSVLACAVAGALCLALFFDQPWFWGALLGAAVAACATLGDLMESVIKRNLGIKDMSNLLPGHGGLMDRLDSLIMTAPLCWAVLHLVVGT